MPNPSTIAMEEEAETAAGIDRMYEVAKVALALTEVEFEALTWRLGHVNTVLDHPEGLDPEGHARYAAEARALRKVLDVVGPTEEEEREEMAEALGEDSWMMGGPSDV